MSELQTLAADIIRYIQEDLSAFEEDCKTITENSQSLPALRFMNNELEELWSNIDGKFNRSGSRHISMTRKYPIR